MKTVLLFTDSVEKRKVILKHSRDILISREVREDHIEWKDFEGNLIKDRAYIVIRIPKHKKIDLSGYKLNWHNLVTMGYNVIDGGDYMEVLFYDQFTFTWNVYELEKYGVFKVTERVIPNYREYGEIFPCYMNPRGVWQTSYDLFFGLIQLPFVWYKKKKNEKLLNSKS